MTFTLNLDEMLVEQLRKQAAARRLSLEAFAVRLLGEAAEQLEASASWEADNQCRAALIRKSATIPLSADEETELEALQGALDQHLESIDDQLLANLQHMQQAVDAVLPDATP
jgi:hypothetical protein